MRALILALAAVPLVAGAAHAQATCAPVSTDASILASPDWSDVHPDWSDGSTVGLGWTLILQGDAEGSDGSYFLYGDLLVADGNLFTPGVYASDMEWECDAP